MKEIAAIVVAFVLAFVVLIGGIAWVMNSLRLPADLAKIEQLRADATHVDPIQAEDVIGQVTVWNQTINANKALNRTWYAGLVIPDEWDSVEPITVPR